MHCICGYLHTYVYQHILLYYLVHTYVCTYVHTYMYYTDILEIQCSIHVRTYIHVRRYWLPGSKLDKLGSSHLDETVIKQCPTRSKRAVHQAYQRAMSFMKTVSEGKSRESQKGPHEPIPVNGPTTGLSENDGTSNSAPPSESDRLGTIEENSLETPPVNNLDEVQQGEHQRVNIWDRNSDEVAAAEQLALLNSYVPASFHEGTNRVVLEESRTTMSNNQHTAVETGQKDRSQACEDMDTSLAQAHCKLQKASREDEFIGEDTSTSSVSGTPEVSSIA